MIAIAFASVMRYFMNADRTLHQWPFGSYRIPDTLSRNGDAIAVFDNSKLYVMPFDIYDSQKSEAADVSSTAATMEIRCP